MAYDSRVYRILIASPSDVDEEREIAVKTIQDWNDLHSYIRRITLLPLRWETHVAPEYGKRPQEVINREIVDECDTGEPVGGSYAVAVERPRVSDLGEVPEPERAKVSELVAGKVFEDTYVPMPLSISNDGSSSVRSLYIEFDICASDDQTEITAYPRDQSGVFNYDFFLSTGVDWVDRPRPGGKPSVRTRTEKNLAKYSAEKLQRVDKYWRLCVACDAVQPQRTRVIRPVLYVSAPKSSEISIQARVFADTSPGPFTLTAKLSIAVTEKEAKLQDVLPSWRDDLKKSVDANGVLGRLMEVASEDVQVLAAT